MTQAATVVVADSLPPQPWKNGGGSTRELLADQQHGADWRWRISLADIAADGPFSPFPGVQRWFAVVDGDGVELAFDKRTTRLRPGDTPLCFDGGLAPGCRLLGGATRDLNLMLRGVGGVGGVGGARGVLRFGLSFDEPWPLRGRFDTATRTLHWGLAAGPLQAAAPALWIGIAP